MVTISQEWIAKAEGDLTTALREYRARNAPNYDAACFHAQQCVEKYMKAVLIAHQISFRRIATPSPLHYVMTWKYYSTHAYASILYGNSCGWMLSC